MGNSTTKCTLPAEEISYYESNTVFNSKEIRAIWFHFMNISQNGLSINSSQFQAALLLKDSSLLDRIFTIFDKNNDKLITFDEYIYCLSIISNKSNRDTKYLFSFQCYDVDNDGYISTNDLTSILASTLHENGIIITNNEINSIVEATMKEVQPKIPDKISFDEFKAFDSRHPLMLSHLTMNISGIIHEYANNNEISLATPRV